MFGNLKKTGLQVERCMEVLRAASVRVSVKCSITNKYDPEPNHLQYRKGGLSGSIGGCTMGVVQTKQLGLN